MQWAFKGKEINPFLLYSSLFMEAHVAYGSSQAKGWIRAAAASLHHSHGNTGSEPYLWPTPQFITIPDT